MKSSSPLDKIFFFLFFLATKFGIVELLFPTFHFIQIVRVEESTVGCLETTLIWIEISVLTFGYCSLLAMIETK
jgi:hypothetical protein